MVIVYKSQTFGALLSGYSRCICFISVGQKQKLTGPRLNIKTVLSTYGDFHVKDKTADRTSYLNMGIAIPGKTVFLIETAPRCMD